MAYRFTSRSLRYRFIQNSIAMWSVFMCLTVMLGFARRNDAAKSKVRIRMIFIPVHAIYLVLLLWGILNDRMAHCKSDRNYPSIFGYQYSVFFLTYFGFVYLHYNDYFMEWHESIEHIDIKDLATHEFLDTEVRARLRVYIIFQ
jgi:hypothetical protein